MWFQNHGHYSAATSFQCSGKTFHQILDLAAGTKANIFCSALISYIIYCISYHTYNDNQALWLNTLVWHTRAVLLSECQSFATIWWGQSRDIKCLCCPCIQHQHDNLFLWGTWAMGDIYTVYNLCRFCVLMYDSVFIVFYLGQIPKQIRI